MHIVLIHVLAFTSSDGALLSRSDSTVSVDCELVFVSSILVSPGCELVSVVLGVVELPVTSAAITTEQWRSYTTVVLMSDERSVMVFIPGKSFL